MPRLVVDAVFLRSRSTIISKMVVVNLVVSGGKLEEGVLISSDSNRQIDLTLA